MSNQAINAAVNELKKEHVRLCQELARVDEALAALGGLNNVPATAAVKGSARVAGKGKVAKVAKRRKVSAAARKKMAEAARARWAARRKESAAEKK